MIGPGQASPVQSRSTVRAGEVGMSASAAAMLAVPGTGLLKLLRSTGSSISSRQER